MQSDDAFIERLTELFRTEGFRHLTIGEMAERLHCSRRRLYGVGDSKDAIFRAVVRRVFDRQLEQGVKAARDESHIAAAISAYLDVGVRGGHDVSPRWVSDIEAGEDTRSIFNAYQQARAEHMKELINKGVSQGQFAPCHGHVIAEAMLYASMRLRQPDFLEYAGVTIEAAFSEFYRVVLNGLLLKKDGTVALERSRAGLG